MLSVNITLLEYDHKRSSTLMPYSEETSNITSVVSSTVFRAFLMANKVTLLLPEPVKARETLLFKLNLN
jgi:hypothetical protein